MQLDRNLPDNDGGGKYALLKLRELDAFRSGTFRTLPPDLDAAIKLLEERGIIDWGRAGTESEFFVIRLKDRYAQSALDGYANECRNDDPEWCAEITDLARRAGPASRWCKYPD